MYLYVIYTTWETALFKYVTIFSKSWSLRFKYVITLNQGNNNTLLKWRCGSAVRSLVEYLVCTGSSPGGGHFLNLKV